MERPRPLKTYSRRAILLNALAFVPILISCNRAPKEPETTPQDFFTFIQSTINDPAFRGREQNLPNGVGVTFSANGNTYVIEYSKENPTIGVYRRTVVAVETSPPKTAAYTLYEDKVVETPPTNISRNLSKQEIAKLEDKMRKTLNAWKETQTY